MIVDDWAAPEDWLRMRWRVGRPPRQHYAVLAQAGPTAKDEDRLVCIADSPELALHITAAHNSLLHITADH